ncbi:MAG: hypothetical protein ACTHJW_16660 [Streptosporangiaceae bacterium]
MGQPLDIFAEESAMITIDHLATARSPAAGRRHLVPQTAVDVEPVA